MISLFWWYFLFLSPLYDFVCNSSVFLYFENLSGTITCIPTHVLYLSSIVTLISSLIFRSRVLRDPRSFTLSKKYYLKGKPSKSVVTVMMNWRRPLLELFFKTLKANDEKAKICHQAINLIHRINIQSI